MNSLMPALLKVLEDTGLPVTISDGASTAAYRIGNCFQPHYCPRPLGLIDPESAKGVVGQPLELVKVLGADRVDDAYCRPVLSQVIGCQGDHPV